MRAATHSTRSCQTDGSGSMWPASGAEASIGYATPGAGATLGGPAGSAPYGEGSASNTGIRSKSCTGTGVGNCHSADFEFHGFASAGSRLSTRDHTTLYRNTSIDRPSTNADTDTQSLSPC